MRTLSDYGVAPDNVLPVEMNYGIRHEILMDYLKCEGKMRDFCKKIEKNDKTDCQFKK